jgi:1-deoxyxylulose-5-phosphate synthase
VGATKDHHVDDAVAAVDVRLSDKELAFLAEPYRPRDVRF